jgi:hypothetical protein
MKYQGAPILAGIAIVALLAGSIRARSQPPPDMPDLSSSSGDDVVLVASPGTSSGSSTDATYAPLSIKEKWLFSVGEAFGPSRLAGYAVHSMFDYALDLPRQWGREGDSLEVRGASVAGTSFIRHDIQFAIQALDHEDPRYFRSGLHGALPRIRYAMLHTFVVRKDDRSWMPAYSLFITDYGTPYLVRQWRPDRFHAVDGVEAGTLGLGVAMGSNIFNEFLPDLKKKLPKLLTFGLR